MRKPLNREIFDINDINLNKDYMTTTELAKLCGVSRFTIINWINQGKIRTNKTVGGHSRIPVSEAISFYETLLKEKIGAKSKSLCHCWEHKQKTNCDKECEGCLIYGNKINYCFLVVREFGKESVHCEGDCLKCDYFEEFFSIYNGKTLPNEIYEAEDVKPAKDKKTFLYSFAYSFGRGIQGIKGKATGIKKVIKAKSTREKIKR
ncbi:MAG: excisionase family DNA-binding protein [Planctomycetes bacterium]|nr:excisionase family DNA-binding protein [Planctomycetota bacterium]